MKPIYLTEEQKKELREEFENSLKKFKMRDGEFKFTQSYKYDDKEETGVIVYYTPSAYTKMRLLINKYEGEVGWRGSIRRLDDKTFLIDDIFVYPQTVTSVTVNTEEDEMAAWYTEMDKTHDEEFCYTYHGHSHVNMSVTPSSVDLEDQSLQLSCMKRGFFLFTIQNKKNESNYWLYDLDNNIMYENKDIDVDILFDDDTDGYGFLEEVKKLVKTKKPAEVKKETGYSYQPSQKYPVYNTQTQAQAMTYPYNQANYYSSEYLNGYFGGDDYARW